ncbi:MAG: hypothetical protein KDG50_06185 [Chromatiales bacterium]|nr:hypothetical protein [Chromatiales bacterium]
MKPIIPILVSAGLVALTGCVSNPEQGGSAAPAAAGAAVSAAQSSQNLRNAQKLVSEKKYTEALAAYEEVTREKVSIEHESSALLGRVMILSGNPNSKEYSPKLAESLAKIMRSLAVKDDNPVLFELTRAAEQHLRDQRRVGELTKGISQIKASIPKEPGTKATETKASASVSDQIEATITELQARVGELEEQNSNLQVELERKELALQRLKAVTIGR